MEKKIELKIGGRQNIVMAESEQRLHKVLATAGHLITTPCDGNGFCGKCCLYIKLNDGSVAEISPQDKALLSERELQQGLRLACQYKVVSAASIIIPDRSKVTRLNILSENISDYIANAIDSLGVAIDIGTTTMVGALVQNGHTIAIATELNLQTQFGADVISRIQHSLNGDGQNELRQALFATLNKLVSTLISHENINSAKINQVVLTGNSVMLHLLHDESLKTLATLPFEPVFKHARQILCREIGIELDLPAYTFPLVGGFVGGDTVGCMIACEMDVSPDTILMIDVGTNGEIALSHRGKCYTASSPAGPAFEGRCISCGMHGSTGAIESFEICNDKIKIKVINGTSPLGVCGTGLIDITAELLKHDVLDYTGLLLDPEEIKIPWLADRIVKENNENAFVIYDPKLDGFNSSEKGSERLTLTQKDFREIQLAKGAIATGYCILIRHAGIELQQLDKIVLAGAFGNYLNPAQARRIGLLPDVATEKLKFIGNAALTGAKVALEKPEYKKRLEQIAVSAEHIELASDPMFQMIYAEEMLFPLSLNQR